MAKIIIDAVDAPGNFHFEDSAIIPPYRLGAFEKPIHYYQRMENALVGRGCSFCGQVRRFSAIQCPCGSHQHVQVSLKLYKGTVIDPRDFKNGMPLNPDGTVDRSPAARLHDSMMAKPVASFTPIPEHLKDTTFADAEDTVRSRDQYAVLDGPVPLPSATPIASPEPTSSELELHNEAMAGMLVAKDEEIARLQAELEASRQTSPNSSPENTGDNKPDAPEPTKKAKK